MKNLLEPQKIRHAMDAVIPAVVACYVAGTMARDWVEQLSSFLAKAHKRLLGLQEAVVVEPDPLPAPVAEAPTSPPQLPTVAEMRKLARAAGQSRSWCRVAKKADLSMLLYSI